jgi:hypothetical protein
MFNFLLQAAQPISNANLEKALPNWLQHVLTFIDTPAPYSPFSEYLLVLFILWLLARRGAEKKKDFSAEAQHVLDEKFKKGEIDRATYEKYRQELSMRLKKE